MIAAVLTLVLAGGTRCEERDESKAAKEALQSLQGTWAAAPCAGGWQIVLSIDGSSATLLCVNDAECLEVMVTLGVEVRKSAGHQVLVLRNPTLPALSVRDLSPLGLTLPGVSTEIPYRQRQEMLLVDGAQLKIAGVPVFGLRVPGAEMRRAFPLPRSDEPRTRLRSKALQ
jgi:hypothetical protein